jgi:elongator complex protein 2
MDKTMVIWRPDAESGVWLEAMRVGEMGGSSPASLFGAVFANSGAYVLGHGYQV